MAYLSDAFAELKTAIETVWPEVSVIFRSPQSARVNWNNLIEHSVRQSASGKTLPYVVLQMSTTQPETAWGMHNHADSVVVNICYIMNANASDDDVSYVESKLQALNHYLETTTFNSFQIVRDCAIDATESQQANDVFLSSNVSLFAGSTIATILVGETISYDA